MGKVIVSAKGNEYSLIIPQNAFKELNLDENSYYEITKAKEGIWILTVSEKSVQKENPLDEKIFTLLKKKNLTDRVEEKFETFLSKEELVRFNELLKEGTIIAFKLSPKYKRAVYKIREEIEKNTKMDSKVKKETSKGKDTGIEGKKIEEKKLGEKDSESFETKEKRPDEYTLEKDGFLIFKNSQNAKILSVKLKKEIDDGKIRGIKSFDGFYYVVQNPVYQKYRTDVLSAIKEKAAGIAGIAEHIGISKMLARVVCELLKDEGEIIEKRKNNFQAI